MFSFQTRLSLPFSFITVENVKSRYWQRDMIMIYSLTINLQPLTLTGILIVPQVRWVGRCCTETEIFKKAAIAIALVRFSHCSLGKKGSQPNSNNGGNHDLYQPAKGKEKKTLWCSHTYAQGAHTLVPETRYLQCQSSALFGEGIYSFGGLYHI